MKPLVLSVAVLLVCLLSSCKRPPSRSGVSPEDLKRARESLATVQREDVLAAADALSALNRLESKGPDSAAQYLVQRLQQFVDAKFPSTEDSEKLREKIREYAATSAAFHAYANSEPAHAGDVGSAGR